MIHYTKKEGMIVRCLNNVFWIVFNLFWFVLYKMKLLELFSGTKSVGKVAEQVGYEVTSLDLKNGTILFMSQAILV